MADKKRPGMLSLLRTRRKKQGERRDNQSHGRHSHHEHMAQCEALCCAKRGQTVSVRHLVGNTIEASRLRDLGVREGVTVTVLRDGDPLMVKVADARFGIGRSAAMNVLCEIHEDTPPCKPR